MNDNMYLEPADITKKLSNISEIMGNGYVFLKLRFALERFEKEARAGHVNSAVLIDIVEKFERLIVVLSKE